MDPTEHAELERQWKAVYGNVFTTGQRYMHGVRAEGEFAVHQAEQFVVVPFLGPIGGPHSIAKHHQTAAYVCDGDLLPLGQFCGIDFFVSPPDMEWTMIHTHEDYGFGGPYFVKREWLVDEPAAPRRSGPRRRSRRGR